MTYLLDTYEHISGTCVTLCVETPFYMYVD